MSPSLYRTEQEQQGRKELKVLLVCVQTGSELDGMVTYESDACRAARSKTGVCLLILNFLGQIRMIVENYGHASRV